jgi:hypothetical protein
MIIDLHCHYTFSRLKAAAPDRFSFEPLPRDGGSDHPRPELPTDYDSCVSPRALRRLTWRLARWYAGLPPAGPELDRELAAGYQRHLHADGPIDRFVLLAFDAVHDDEGRCLPLPGPGDKPGSDMYTSNSLVRDVCGRFPDRFLFGASVHPYRPDAVACLEEVFAAGACLLKWLPLHHNIDVANPRSQAVLRRCSELGLPVLVHFGEEFTLATQCPQYRSIRPLLEVLRQLRREDRMPCTIVAHAATPVLPLGERDSHRALLAALTGEFADAPLYADLAALATWAKAGFLRRLARRPKLHAKLLFGSDFPVPPGLPRLWWELRRDYRRLAAMGSWPQQAAAACRCLGFSEIVLHRAGEILPNTDFFARAAAPRPA